MQQFSSAVAIGKPSAIALVKAGIGCAIVPKGNVAVIPGCEAMRTVVIDPPIYMTACLISSGDMPLTAAAEAVSALVAAQVEMHFKSASC
ncbi:hypothetical protein [Rhizobium gallicum]|uniref:hypothetical protein n=1 Tax=Rhizobium gallicum TaxID=56730 RepID=UPI001EF85CBA|nr:hypothetical protein [Rhizobium gallicum]ULJ74462.1 hypothetical protein L2W42_21630 [Rhizobium gallicum]